MELEEAVRGRRSIRHFLNKPVSEEMVEDLIAKSLWAPSRGNTQPWEIFDAPAVILVAVDKELSLEYAILDVGILLQTFCLLAHGRGLGTCILAASVNYPEIVRDLFAVPENMRLVMGTALGWPDWSAPVNCFERSRGAPAEFVRWVR
jgi:nitroreductase